MQRVKRTTAVAVLPADPGGGTPGFFATPNPGGGVPATVPGYEWYNNVQEELLAVIEGQSLAPSGSDRTQLRQAIAKMIQASQRAVVVDGVTFNAGVANGNALYWDALNTRFDKALADGSAKQNAVGFADVTNSKVYAFGDAVLFSGLTAGSRYYLDGTTAGDITVTAPTNAVFMGIARSATEVFVDIDAGAGVAKQIQPITASVAGNALTLTLNPTALDFRSSALTSGAVNTRTVAAPISVVVSSGSTLGTIAATAARLVVIAIDNAGTVELAVANLAGGLNLDETTLISTTAEGGAGAAASVGVIYSTTARAAVPFRVVGFIAITEAVAGTWATAPATIQGAGGQALAAMSSIGYGQSWQNMTASRANNTTYYNTTGRLIMVLAAMSTSAGSASISATVQGVTITGSTGASGGSNGSIAFVVPPGAAYLVTIASFGTLANWSELR